ncbi:MAG: phage virion morphogenesis protein [Tepidimonas taiwanensis]|nr:phage virion morphogenesis protein [Tepidimonas taiwanensis]
MIDIQLDDREVQAALQRLQQRISDMTPVMRAIATALEAQVEKRFETATDPAGRPWKPLAPSTLSAWLDRGKGNRKKDGSLTQRGRERLSSRKPLYDTGDLLGSLNSSFTRSQARVGFGVPYAIMHQFGAKKGEYGTGSYKKRRGSFPIPWGDVPARPMLPITRDGKFYGEERAVVLDILVEFLDGKRTG